MNRLALLPLLLALPVSLLAREADACGGTFCDNSLVPMPVDQRGEDILFVQDGPEIEVHVRIQYEGEAERFAWLVPLSSLPEISVGSDALFGRLSQASAPSWRTSTTYQCDDEDGWGSTMGFVPENDFAGAPEPDVVLEQTVGAFEVVVLDGGTAAEVVNFLQANDYAQDPAATPLIQDYLDEGFLFAAVKLTADADVEDIHPLVFRMQGDEPCVPLRLTSIAAEDDMGVRAYFLGELRWGPLNYLHVELNTLAYPWDQATAWFLSSELHAAMLSQAVDLAGGRAFVTDYAGDSAIVDQSGVYSDLWDAQAFIGVDPVAAIDLIAQQGLNTHPLIQGLLLQFIPPPDLISPINFWNGIELYQDQIDLAAWDSVAFAAALTERIIEPGVHAVELLDTWPYLTRVQTLISPHEMTVDPIFAPMEMLPDVDNRIIVEKLDLCGETGSTFAVPWQAQLREVCLGEYESWPASLRAYPLLRSEKLPLMGPPQVIDNYAQDIAAALSSHQASQDCGDAGGADGGSEGSEGSGGSPGDAGGEGETGGASLSDDGAKAGCACQADERSRGHGALALLGLALLGWRRRRA